MKDTVTLLPEMGRQFLTQDKLLNSNFNLYLTLKVGRSLHKIISSSYHISEKNNIIKKVSLGYSKKEDTDNFVNYAWGKCSWSSFS